MVENDFIKKENALKLAPVMDALGFISAILHTQALSWALFTLASPLMKDLQDLYKIVVNGYQNGDLEAANEMQPHCYMHQLWSLYKYISKFFTKRLLEQDLQNGQKLCNPLEVYNSEIAKFTDVHTSGVPKPLLPPA